MFLLYFCLKMLLFYKLLHDPYPPPPKNDPTHRLDRKKVGMKKGNVGAAGGLTRWAGPGAGIDDLCRGQHTRLKGFRMWAFFFKNVDYYLHKSYFC